MDKKVKPPAIALLVVAGLTLLTVLGAQFLNEFLLRLAEQFQMPDEQLEQLREAVGKSREEFGVLNMLGYALNAIGILLIAVGAWRMKDLKSYGLAITASILAMIPCFSSCCCLIGLPVGIWALIVLMDKDVKAAFGLPVEPPPI